MNGSQIVPPMHCIAETAWVVNLQFKASSCESVLKFHYEKGSTKILLVESNDHENRTISILKEIDPLLIKLKEAIDAADWVPLPGAGSHFMQNRPLKSQGSCQVYKIAQYYVGFWNK